MRCYHTLDRPELLEFEHPKCKYDWLYAIVRAFKRILRIPHEPDTELVGIPIRIDVKEDGDGFLLRQYYRNRPFDLKLVYDEREYVLHGAKVASLSKAFERDAHFYIHYQSIK